MKTWRLLTVILACCAFAAASRAQYIGAVHSDGPHKLVIASGGELEIQSGGTLDVQSGSTIGFATIDINGGTIDGTVIGGASAAAVTGTTITGTTITDGTISFSSGTFSGIADLGSVTTADINAGTFDGIVGGTTPAACTATTLTATTVTDGTATLVGGTVTGLVALTSTTLTGTTITDGTASLASGTFSGIADLGSVNTADINAGTFDGIIGGTTPAACTATTLTATTVTDGTATLVGGTFSGIVDLGAVTTADINGGTIDATNIGASTPGTGAFTTLGATGAITNIEGALSNSTVIDDDIKADTLTTAKAANLAANATMAGYSCLLIVDCTGGASTTYDITVSDKYRVVDAWIQHYGGAGEANDTLTVQNGSNAITNAIAYNGNDKALVRAGEIDDAQAVISSGGTLRVVLHDDDTGSDLGAAYVYVLVVPSS